jgi:FtsP/CotA-like multicopper oxidase with cupredoxin domain
LLPAGIVSELPKVAANDNRKPAGTFADGVLDVSLEVDWADFRPETDDGPGIRLVAISETGKSPSIPAPLIRTETGTRVRVTVRNLLEDSTVTAFGFQERPSSQPDSFLVTPGGASTVEFEAGPPGTYLYWLRLGGSERPRHPARQQLSGAFVIDPVGGSPPDRIFVMNIWSERVDSTIAETGRLEALTINGKSWPYTELQRLTVGDTTRWRIVNGSRRNHPMHLHGFFYDVTSVGSTLKDSVYVRRDYRKVVTETMSGRTTMQMEFVPTRPGNWLFHCHLSFHVAPAIRLPGALDPDGKHAVHMAGLVLGLQVDPGPTDLVERGPPRYDTLYVNEYVADTLFNYGFALDPEFRPDSTRPATPGPLLELTQYQPTYVTVVNRMSIPTGVHWHGLELDSWADGVPGWSASDGRVSPVIPPGESFTYKLSLMRPGTFIYHSHLDDVDQLTGGLYGPLLVLPDGERYDPAEDHLAVVGWTRSEAELNGRQNQPEQHAVVGDVHRIRLINIAPAGRVSLSMHKYSAAVPLTFVAKDGADLPEHQCVEVEESMRIGVGETADFTFSPAEPGEYELQVGYRRNRWKQRWIVSAKVD